jgi:anti-sigma regulatory factor (Ser/Thr protein kinase)
MLEACPMVADAVLLISELCANAVQHSDSRYPGGTFTMHVEGGHGLAIVRTVASDWGRDGDAGAGRVVWYRLDWPVT